MDLELEWTFDEINLLCILKKYYDEPIIIEFEILEDNHLISLPIVSKGNYVVEFEHYTAQSADIDIEITNINTYTCKKKGIYIVTIKGNITSLCDTWNVQTLHCLTKVINFGSTLQKCNFHDKNNWTGAINLVSVSENIPETLTDVSCMFYGATNFNQNINSWNTQNVNNMKGMFFGATNFDQPLNSWGVQNVTDMKNMFNGATKFNKPINSWNTQNVVSMKCMFLNARNFNQSLDFWNVSNVTDMTGMFYNASNLIFFK